MFEGTTTLGLISSDYQAIQMATMMRLQSAIIELSMILQGRVH